MISLAFFVSLARRTRGAAVLLGLLANGPVAGQAAGAGDSAQVAPGPPCPPVAAPRRRAGFVLSLDNRNSFVQSSAVRIIGVNAGVVLPNGRWRLGLGGYTLSRNYANLYIYQYKNGKRTRKILDTLTPSSICLTSRPTSATSFCSARGWS